MFTVVTELSAANKTIERLKQQVQRMEQQKGNLNQGMQWFILRFILSGH